MPAVADESFRVGFFAAFTGFFASPGAAGRGDFRSRADGDEATFFAMCADDGREVDEVAPEASQVFLQIISVFQHGTRGQRQAGEPPGLAQLDGGELAQAEVAHIPQHQIAAPDFHDELFADGFVLGGGGVQGVGNDAVC